MPLFVVDYTYSAVTAAGRDEHRATHRAWLADEGKDTFIGERINLTHRFRRPHKHRIYLGIVLPDGKIATNKKCTPPQAPEDDDPTTPWLYGGKSYSRQSETGATYFLSPRPEGSSEVVFTISYPEIGIDRASSITLDFTRFTRSGA
jgi:hypothetical protein